MAGRIVAHDDFDGISSAAIVMAAVQMKDIIFTGPRSITSGTTTVNSSDIVVDLPYPLTCAAWFDHHPGNMEEIRFRKIDPDTIPGKFEEAPSCTGVVHRYYSIEMGLDLPVFFTELVTAADRIDSFDYSSIDEWREETPANIVDAALKAPAASPTERYARLSWMARSLSESPLTEFAGDENVLQLAESFRSAEKKMLRIIESSVDFHPMDTEKRVVVLDLTIHRKPPRIVRNLCFLIFRDADVVLEINNRMKRGVKTNDLTFSMSMGIGKSLSLPRKDLGEIMRTLGIGDGHAGAAAGSIDCSSKQEMLRVKKNLTRKILEQYFAMT